MSDTPVLAPIFLANIPDGTAALPPAITYELETLLGDIVATGSAAWPDLSLPAEAFVRHLARHCPKTTAPDPYPAWKTWLTSLPFVQDLYLACACTEHIRGALEVFEERYIRDIAVVLRGADAGHIDEVRQLLRCKFFVFEVGVLPKIASYAGRASLKTWVRITAGHTSISEHRRRPGPSLDGEEDALIEALSEGQHAQGSYLDEHFRRQYQAEFKDAYRTALRALTVEQRNVLRLHFIDGLNLEKIGVALRAGRSSVHRWLLDARRTVRRQTRKQLDERLHLSPSDLDSLERVLLSQLDASIVRFLAEGVKKD